MRASVLAFSVFSSLASAQTPTLAELIQSQSDLSTLADALTIVPDFATLASGLTNITILAPTNAAFEALLALGTNAENQAITTRDPDGVSTLLAYHVIKGTYLSTDFTEIPTFYNTVFNQSYSIFNTVRTNVTEGQNVGLVLNGQNATILSGELNYSNVVEADITTIPGITIHKIDQVLTIPLNLSDTLLRLDQLGTSAVLGALDTAGLIDRIDSDGESEEQTLDTIEDITVFIPNNDAFVAAASAFQNASVEVLTEVLEYHAIQGSVVFASDIANGSVQTVQGSELTLSVGYDGTVYVDNARVILPNILLSNGVAHIIDTVLNPNAADVNSSALNPTASATPAFSGATPVGTDIPFTASAITPSTTIDIPPIATTAEFVTPQGGAATPTGNATVTGPTPSVYTGGAQRNLGEGLMSGAMLGLIVGMVMQGCYWALLRLGG